MDKEDIELLKSSVKDVKNAFAGNMAGISEIVSIDPKTNRKHRLNLEKINHQD